MPPIIVQQANEYSEDLHFNVPLEWTVHNTPYWYKDKYRWIKATTQLSNVCGAYPVKNQIIFFDVHDSHFDDRALIHMEHQNIQPFILKAGDSIKDHPNGNGSNAKLKHL